MSYNKQIFICNNLIHYKKKNPLEFTKSQKLTGLQIEIKGRLKGAKRAKTVVLNKGNIKAQTQNFYLQAYSRPIQTKWGKYGLSLLLGYN